LWWISQLKGFPQNASHILINKTFNNHTTMYHFDISVLWRTFNAWKVSIVYFSRCIRQFEKKTYPVLCINVLFVKSVIWLKQNPDMSCLGGLVFMTIRSRHHNSTESYNFRTSVLTVGFLHDVVWSELNLCSVYFYFFQWFCLCHTLFLFLFRYVILSL
jgi:hypothetical protein